MDEHKWEILYQETSSVFTTHLTARMKVPGGWLYRVELDEPSSEDSRQMVLAVTFVPDPPTRPKATKGPTKRATKGPPRR